MQLFHAAASPFVRKVMVVLHETAQLAEVACVPATVSPVGQEGAAHAHNPLGKIPVLTRPDGPALYDSRVICRYLGERAGGALYPAPRIWEVLTLEALADGMMDAAISITYEGRLRPEGGRSQDWIAGQWGKIDRALDALEEGWMSHLAGPLDIGQIAVGCALGYLDFRHDTKDWRQGHGALARWFERFEQRASMRESRPSA
ncbi:glutathione S-transferase [Profundibacterium mesophilum]|uniref:Glutathione S-transferase n=1 Tax=Profundibacterium mesophilum KAUST100406-0324 TaxID=1037889 RepID=A0A921NW46_9RHOB|nr:glutathione S-transferase [Profundibacterium mesophilum]KAF0676421.1 glutathione S-transferase [Profundibacterium mesophilum KAUST100406-0324]